MRGNDEYEHEKGRGQRREKGRLAEKATSPRSTASCSRFSVGSSVLSFGIDVAAHRSPANRFLQPHPNLSGFCRRAAKLDLIAARHAEHDVGDGLARLGDVPRRRYSRRN